MYQKYRDRVQFYMVYIREAHPTDGWQVGSNRQQGILIKQPTTLLQRTQVADEMCRKLDLSIPAVIDSMDDVANKAYSGWPDRLYLVSAAGRIAYMGGPGPRGFRPAELQQAIEKELPNSLP